MNNVMFRDEAWQIVCEFTKSESLRKHMLAVETAMVWYARHFNEDENKFSLAGLLHDFDYEMYPTSTDENKGHPYWAVEYLRQKQVDNEILEAVLAHANYTNTPRNTILAKTLFAVDELSGFIIAAALIRPDKSLENLEAKSVIKRMKDKAFAKGVSREDIIVGAEDLNLELEDHINNVIKALCSNAKNLGFLQ